MEMKLDPKALDAASYAMQEASFCSCENICETCRKNASAVVAAYLTHAFPAIEAAAERRGIERAAMVAHHWAVMPAVVTTERKRFAAETAHWTAAQIETEIRALTTEPTP